MTKYRCDVTTEGKDAAGQWMSRCPNPAVIAFDHLGSCGLELLHFCAEHQPTDWSQFEAVYHIKDDELVETGISKVERETRDAEFERVKREVHEMVGDAIKRYQERKADEKWLRQIGVRP